MEDRTDLRIRYTRELLRRSLIELMKTRSIADLSITDICREAGINRGTFYRHYATPYEILEQVQNELFGKIRESVEKATSGNDIAPVLEEIFRAIAENGDLCRVILSDKGDKEFLRKILNIAHDRIVAEWRRQYRLGDSDRYHLAYTFIVNGSLGVIQDWIDGGFARSPRAMAQFLDAITARGLRGEFSPPS